MPGKLTDEERKGMLDILMDPDDPRDVSACRSYIERNRADHLMPAPETPPPLSDEDKDLRKKRPSSKKRNP